MAILLCNSNLENTITTYPLINDINEKIDELKKEVNKTIRIQAKKSWIKCIQRRKRYCQKILKILKN